jgi:hypothetical protein
MPPKKGKGKKAAGSDDVEVVGAPDPFPGSEELVQAMDAKTVGDRIARLEKQNRVLIRKNKLLRAEVDTTNSEQADVYVYLHQKLDDNFEVIATLEAKVVHLETERDKLQAQLKAAAESHANERKALETRMQREIDELQTQLDALVEFKEAKERMEQEIADLRAMLEEERAAHAEEVLDLERRNVAAKDKLKREMFRKIKETKRNILKATEDQLDNMTKRTMAENEQMTTELTYQSQQTEKLMAMNNAVRDENKRLKREAELQSQAQQELVKRTHFFQKLIRKLNDTIKRAEERERALRVDLERATAGSNQQALILSLRQQLDEARAEIVEANRRAEDAEAKGREAVEELERRDRLNDDMLEFLQVCVADERHKLHERAIRSSTMRSESAGAEGTKTSEGAAMPARSPRLTDLDMADRGRVLDVVLARLDLQKQRLEKARQDDGEALDGGDSIMAIMNASGLSPRAGLLSEQGLDAEEEGKVDGAVTLPPIGSARSASSSKPNMGARPHSPVNTSSRPPTFTNSGKLHAHSRPGRDVTASSLRAESYTGLSPRRPGASSGASSRSHTRRHVAVRPKPGASVRSGTPGRAPQDVGTHVDRMLPISPVADARFAGMRGVPTRTPPLMTSQVIPRKGAQQSSGSLGGAPSVDSAGKAAVVPFPAQDIMPSVMSLDQGSMESFASSWSGAGDAAAPLRISPAKGVKGSASRVTMVGSSVTLGASTSANMM